MDYNKILEEAMQWAIANHPNASNQHRAAFANSVAYLVTGASGGYSGPSIREHAVSWALVGDGQRIGIFHQGDPRIKNAGAWSLEEAIAFADPICFGPLPATAATIYNTEHCFNDDPADLAELLKK